MRITINRPTKAATEFAHDYLNKVRDELPNTYEYSRPSQLIGIQNVRALINGDLDDNSYDIAMYPFNWLHYFILKRYLARIQETNKRIRSIISGELGLSLGEYNTLFKPSFNTKPKPNGGKKRSRRVRRTHRRRA
jgi:hypothetical protein